MGLHHPRRTTIPISFDLNGLDCRPEPREAKCLSEGAPPRAGYPQTNKNTGHYDQ